MFIPHLTRWLRLPGKAGGPEPVWVSPPEVKPDEPGLVREDKLAGYYLVHDWFHDPDHFEPLEEMFVFLGGELHPNPCSVGDRIDPLVRAFDEERLWLWRVQAFAVAAPAVFPAVPGAGKPTEPGKTELGTLLVRVIDEVGQPLIGIALEFDRNGKKTTLTTDGSGVAKMVAVTESFASVRIAGESPVRDELRARWEQVRGRPWVDVESLGDHTEVAVRRYESIQSVNAFLDEPHTLVLEPWVTQLLLHGMWFETSKCFLLPSAVEGARFTVKASRERPSNDLLIVGHTDPSGDPAYNDPLSLERAEATLAYLRNDVEAWYAWYGPTKAEEKRWGSREDLYMIEHLAVEHEQTLPLGRSPVRWYQETRGLTVDGIAGPITRHALIREYMELTGTTLDPSTRAESHGCGENFPRDGATAQDQRFVEAFLFENPIAPSPNPPAILPPAPAKNSPPGSKVYPEWVLRARETLEHAVGVGKEPADLHVSVLLRSNSGRVPIVDRPFVFHFGDGRELVGKTGLDGLVEVEGLHADDYQLYVDKVGVMVPAMPTTDTNRPTRIPGYYIYRNGDQKPNG